ncbi:MFS transporter [Nitrospirillum iridis]|uniref:GPH family glycoside/pentoside/hexuronide:cation symporter n=1 Tax=Nitrospirillum iridis TaxID=765888 RepID=A0A7X0AZN8_9PROT|nr:MFS transporter [Nitrospirillum iridis]MBB6253102.1 GPH family glycoside/pentoside/hexuronide:cation symporter [Nitrospirillum iridis]
MSIALSEEGSVSPGRLGLLAQAGYGVGQIAGQVFRDVPSLLLMFFMTNVLGIEPALAGAAIFVPKLVWGVGCDLLVGILSDRWKHRFARRGWLLVGALGAPVALILLFHVPDLSVTGRVAYVAVAFSLYMAVFACFSVPYLAIAGELSGDPHQRTVLMAWRLVFTAIGVLVGGALSPYLVQSLGGGQAAYEGMSKFLAVVCPTALVLAYFGSGRARRQAAALPPPAAHRRLAVREVVAILTAPRFSVLLLANLLQLAGSGMAYASMLYFLTYNMARSDAFQLIGGLVIIACAGIVAAQPAWVALARRIGKKPVYILAAAGYGVAYLGWSMSAGAGTVVAYAFSFAAAIFNSGWTLLGFSMMSDVAGDDQAHAGLYSAAWIAVDKVGFALGGTLLVGIVLSGFGFDAARAVSGQPQTDLALTGVMLAFGVVPALLNLSSAVLFWRFGRV